MAPSNLTRGGVVRAAAIAAVLFLPAAHAQVGSPSSTRSLFVFATAADGGAILGARDEFVRAMTPLERSMRLKTSEPVDEDRLARFMGDMAFEWEEQEKQQLAPLVQRLDLFLSRYKGRRPDRILLVQANPLLEEGFPHTRANAIVLPKGLSGGANLKMAYYLGHETFHVLSRYDAALREKVYSAIGFRRCDAVDIPESVDRLRITNPDAVENRHTIRVRYQDRAVEALPYVRLASGNIDPREGFAPHLSVRWLLVERDGQVCRARRGGPDEGGVVPEVLEGLFEQIGRNTRYLLHPEEVLADNFAFLYMATLLDKPPVPPSPEILERLRAILFE